MSTYIDVDGHILGPGGLWMEYIEPRYRDRTLKILEDEDGLEYLSIDGEKSWFGGGVLAVQGAIGEDSRPYLEPGRLKREESLVPGGYDPHERVKVMDAEGLDKTLVYPSLGLLWEADCKDAELAAANCRAYNNWVFDFCKPYPDRLIPVTHIPTLDVAEAVKELRRTARLGTKAIMISGTAPGGRVFGSSYFDPLWKEAEGLGMPVTLHPCTGPHDVARQFETEPSAWWTFMVSGVTVQLQFTTFFDQGTFERFPKLKLVVLESGVGWLVDWIHRMDAKFEINGFTTPMKMKPSEYFQRNCWISMDPDERSAKFSVEQLGADRFMWAYDYPHSDAVTDPVNRLTESLGGLPFEHRDQVLAENAKSLYGI